MEKTFEKLKKEFPEEWKMEKQKLKEKGDAEIEGILRITMGYVRTISDPKEKTMKGFLKLAFSAGELHELNKNLYRDLWVHQRNFIPKSSTDSMVTK